MWDKSESDESVRMNKDHISECALRAWFKWSIARKGVSDFLLLIHSSLKIPGNNDNNTPISSIETHEKYLPKSMKFVLIDSKNRIETTKFSKENDLQIQNISINSPQLLLMVLTLSVPQPFKDCTLI